MHASPQRRPPRQTYTEAQIRANALADGDVLRDAEGTWREVLDVWTDDDLDVAIQHYTEDDVVNRGRIVKHLTGFSQYVMVRILIEEQDAVQITHELIALRSCTLVTIQVPHHLRAPYRTFPHQDPQPTTTDEKELR